VLEGMAFENKVTYGQKGENYEKIINNE